MDKQLKRQTFYSGIPLEKQLGYARMIKIGNYIRIGGTAAVEIEGPAHAPGDVYEQTKFIFDRFLKLLKDAGAEAKDVYAIRGFTVNDDDEGFGRAFTEYFAKYHPIATKYEIAKFGNPDLRVEIELEAYIGSYTD
jgi:enamine deaminase RidA (YjgF/YER057c/UK114 family)